MATVPKLITAAASHQLYIERLAAKFGNDAIPYLKSIDRQVKELLDGLHESVLSARKQAQVIKQIDEIARSELQAYVREYKKDNAEYGAYEANWQSGLLDDVVVSDSFVAETAIPSAVREITVGTPIKLGENLYTTYGKYTAKYWEQTADQINGIVVNAFNSGLTNQQASSQIYDQIKLGKSGTALTKAREAAKTMARTGTNHMANSARRATLDVNDDVVTGWLFAATLDNRTSRQCSALDGTTYKASDKNIPFPPLHPNCRSMMTYEIDARYSYEDDSSERPSNFHVGGERDPKRVNTKQTYYDELAKLSASDQNAALNSPTLGKAFRKMDNKDDFAEMTIDSLNQPLTIKEMRAADNELGRILRNQE